MKMKNIFIFLLLCLLLPWTSQAQELLQNFKTDKITVTQDFKMEIDFAPSHGVLSMRYTLLPDGIVYLNDKYNQMYCYNFNNTLRWQTDIFPEDLGRAVIVSSTPDGHYIYTFHPTNESEGYSVIWDQNGLIVWKKHYSGSFRVGPSNKYIYSGFDGIGGHTPIAILDITNGNVIMEIDHYRMYWNSASSANNELAVAHNGWLRLYDMTSGQELWKRSIEGDKGRIENYAKVFISYRGNIIAVQELVGDYKNGYLKTYVYNQEGILLWDEENKVSLGITNGGRIKAISENETFILRGDQQRLYAQNARTGEEIWSIENHLNLQVSRFTEDAITFRSTRSMRDPAPFTRVLFLDGTGTPLKDQTFSQMIDFGKPGMQLKTKKMSDAAFLPALILEKKSTGMLISALNVQSKLAER